MTDTPTDTASVDNGSIKDLDLTYTPYVRKPFVVEAVEVTEQNIETLAPYIGDLMRKPSGMPYIKVDPEKVEKVDEVYPGFLLTVYGSKLRCYSRKIFFKEFADHSPEAEAWVNFMNKQQLTEPA